MNPKALELALKRQRLQVEAAAQRVMLLQTLASAAPALGIADKAGAGWRWVKAHPQWLAALAALLLVARPRGVLRWTRRGFLLWRSARKARSAIDALLSAR